VIRSPYHHSDGGSLCLSTDRCPLWGRSGVFWVAEMKRDPFAPFESAVGALLSELLLGQDTSYEGRGRIDFFCFFVGSADGEEAFTNR
jgi:hypothetical protein